VLAVKVSLLILLSIVALTACAGFPAVFEFYVVIKPDETEKFITTIKAIAKEDGLETATGQAVSDTGNVLRVLESRGNGLTLWVQSAMVSGKEDPKLCGVHPEPYPDPAQFIVFTEPRLFGSKAAAIELGERVFSRLHNAGFDVRRKQVVCGAAVIHDHS
jgi:hypothetical protein